MILMHPAILLYDLETVWLLVEFTLDDITLFNGQVQDLGLSELKYEIVGTAHDHIEYLENPEIAAECEYKGLLDFQFKLTPSLLIHLNKKFLQKLIL